MPYASGVANNVDDLISALEAACVSGGWALSAGAGYNVMSKDGMNVCCFKVGAPTQYPALGFGGTTNFLLPGYVTTGTYPWMKLAGVYPISYRIFVVSGGGANTVFLSIREANLVDFQYLAFGNLENKVGTYTGGEWISGAYGSRPSGANKALASTGTGLAITNVSGGNDAINNANSYGQHCGIFVEQTEQPNSGADFFAPTSYVRCDIDGAAMCSSANRFGAVDGTTITMMRFAKLPLMRGLNLWNGESVLVPMHLYLNRASLTVSRIGTIGHIRLVRYDNYETGDIITLGTDRWMLLPIFKRNTAAPGGAKPGFVSFDGHSGTLAYAIKYDGP